MPPILTLDFSLFTFAFRGVALVRENQRDPVPARDRAVPPHRLSVLPSRADAHHAPRHWRSRDVSRAGVERNRAVLPVDRVGQGVSGPP